VPITLDQSEGVCLLRLEGEIKIASAAELKRLLLQALAARGELRVDLEHATDVDVTALQLLWAAGREARASGTGFRLVGSVPKEVLMTANETGFESFPVGANPE
jgi:anti-anti-sigma factor